jgi:branched-chain amino acid transport system permease protein
MTLLKSNSLIAASCLIALVCAVLAPKVIDLYSLLSLSVFLVMAILALSLAFVWGYGGILCFGQAAFFGLGAYAYSIAAINLGDSTWAVVISILVPTLFAAALGYFIFYGGITDVYLGVITLAVSIIFFNLVNSTSGPEYHIGSALLGGFNGIPSVPTLNMPFDSGTLLDPEQIFQVIAVGLIAVYVLLKVLLATKFGKVVVAVRESEHRASLLGYDTRLHKLLVFSIGGAIAGLAGCFYANWSAFVSPGVFSLSQSAQIIIWVLVGGRGTLLGPILACVAIQWLMTKLGAQQAVDGGLVLGLILLAFVMLVPKGILPTVTAAAMRLRRKPAQKKAELEALQ